jgi:hypothetical protein
LDVDVLIDGILNNTGGEGYPAAVDTLVKGIERTELGVEVWLDIDTAIKNGGKFSYGVVFSAYITHT